MKKYTLLFLILTILTSVCSAQFGMGSVGELKKIKESKLYVVNFSRKGFDKDYNERINSFIKSVENNWNFCSYEIITGAEYDKIDKSTKASCYFLDYDEPHNGEGAGSCWFTINKGKTGIPWQNIAGLSFSASFQPREVLLTMVEQYVRLFNFYLKTADSIESWNVMSAVNESVKKIKDKTLIMQKANFGLSFNEEKIRSVYTHPIQIVTLTQLYQSVKNQEDKTVWLVLSCYHTGCDAVIDIPTGQILYLSKPIKSSNTVFPQKANLLELSSLLDN
jgi:hypothetical protein